MADPTWWAFHAVQVVVLCLAVALAYEASRRIGAHTPYGTLLFLLAVGFWLILVAELLYLGRQALGTWEGPGGLNDLVQLPGWALLVASVGLFVTRFLPSGAGRLRLAAVVVLPAVVLLALFRLWLSPPGADPDAAVRWPYLLLDGLAIGFVVVGIERFLRLRESALGRLYMFLGAAVVLKAAGDIMWAYLAARGASSLAATLMYPLAGLLAVGGLAWHRIDMRREALHGRPVGAPWLRTEQRRLRDISRQLHGVAGGYAARTVLNAAGGAFAERGLPWRLEGDMLHADAGDAVWQDALQRAKMVAVHSFGAAGEKALQSLGGRP